MRELDTGGAVAIDPIVPAAPTIVEAFYPSVRGGEALAMMAFGENRFGKLPITMSLLQPICNSN